MRRGLTLFCLAAAAVFWLSVPAFAQDEQIQGPSHPVQPGNAAKVQNLQGIIEGQQRQLDAQQEQLEAQEKKLQELRQQVQGLAEGAAPPKAAVAEKSEAILPRGALPRRTDIHTRRRDKAQPHDEWKGSFAVERLNTRFKIGGFVQLDVIHDTDAIASEGQFITSAIVTRDATKAEGSDGQTNVSVNPSQLYFETRTPIKQGRLTIFLSMDFYGNALSAQPDPRLRQAYGELTNIVFGGDLLAGQAWTTFADLEAFPNVLDFQGPNSFFGGLRQPMVRWTRGVADGLKLMAAVETPDNHIIPGADSLTAWPDGVLSMVWHQAPAHLKGSFVARDLRASFNDGPTETAFGWGVGVSGKVWTPFLAEKDFFTFSVAYGEGIGSVINDQPPDAVFDSGGGLEAVPLLGWFVSYEHWWSRQFYSTLVYGILDVDNRNAQPPDSLNQTHYASGNFVWMPTERWLFGGEGLWGRREDKDGEDGTDFRAQFTGKFIF